MELPITLPADHPLQLGNFTSAHLGTFKSALTLRQEVTGHQPLGLLPGLVVLSSVKLDVLGSKVGEGAGFALCPPLRYRVLALGHVEHDPGSKPPGVGQGDRLGVAEVKPARLTLMTVDHLPGPAP